MGWDPTQVDYAQLFGIYRDAEGTSRPFVDALTSGAKKFESRWGTNIASDASLLWWLGYGQQSLGAHDDAVASFEKSVKKYPAFSNSHWYIGLAKYNKGDEHYEDAVASWQTYADVDRAGFIALGERGPHEQAHPRLRPRASSTGEASVATKTGWAWRKPPRWRSCYS